MSDALVVRIFGERGEGSYPRDLEFVKMQVRPSSHVISFDQPAPFLSSLASVLVDPDCVVLNYPHVSQTEFCNDS